MDEANNHHVDKKKNVRNERDLGIAGSCKIWTGLASKRNTGYSRCS